MLRGGWGGVSSIETRASHVPSPRRRHGREVPLETIPSLVGVTHCRYGLRLWGLYRCLGGMERRGSKGGNCRGEGSTHGMVVEYSVSRYSRVVSVRKANCSIT